MTLDGREEQLKAIGEWEIMRNSLYAKGKKKLRSKERGEREEKVKEKDFFFFFRWVWLRRKRRKQKQWLFIERRHTRGVGSREQHNDNVR